MTIGLSDQSVGVYAEAQYRLFGFTKSGQCKLAGLPSSILKHMTDPTLNADVESFAQQGYLVVPGIFDPAMIEQLLALIERSLTPPLAPVEFEADVHYPGAPASREAPGGETPRRLLHAYTRDALFQQCARAEPVVSRLQRLIGAPSLCLSQNHHNCIMTKYPGFSSQTSWHQDIRYWSFDRPELVSTWLALGDENRENGGLLVIPGSHRVDLDRGRLDAALFLRTDLDDNRELIDQAVTVELKAGDMLFFHSRTFHAAGQNLTDQVKRSLVYTYRAANNAPIPETRSANYPDLPVN